jgi:hypothetical protein
MFLRPARRRMQFDQTIQGAPHRQGSPRATALLQHLPGQKFSAFISGGSWSHSRGGDGGGFCTPATTAAAPIYSGKQSLPSPRLLSVVPCLGHSDFRPPSSSPNLSSCCSRRSSYFAGMVLRGCAVASSSTTMYPPVIACLIRALLAT